MWEGMADRYEFAFKHLMLNARVWLLEVALKTVKDKGDEVFVNSDN